MKHSSEQRLEEELRSILSDDPRQKELDVQKLLQLNFNEAESVAAAQILNRIIEKRWKLGAHVLSCNPEAVDLSLFQDVPEEEYEHMPTKVLRDSVWEGIGKLLISFKPGAVEDTRAHRHPGGRIIFSPGDAHFTAYDSPEKSQNMRAGDIILMPEKERHNFAAGPKELWTPLSFHVGYAGTGKEAIEYDDEQ